MKNERRELMYVVPPGLSTREPLHHGFTPMTTTCRHFLATSVVFGSAKSEYTV